VFLKKPKTHRCKSVRFLWARPTADAVLLEITLPRGDFLLAKYLAKNRVVPVRFRLQM